MGKCCNKTVHLTACIATIVSILAGAGYIVLLSMRKKVLLNLDEYGEVFHEWGTAPFTSVGIVQGNEQCPATHPEMVLYDSWPGLEIACYCDNSTDLESVMG